MKRGGAFLGRWLGAVVLLTSGLGAEEEDGGEQIYRFPREQRDLELRSVSPKWRAGFQVGGSAYEERHSDAKERDSSIEGLDLEFIYEASERFEAQLKLNYEFDGSKRLIFEETFLSYDLVEGGEWFVEAGRMELPFGEYSSNFVEDPLTQVIGETYDGSLIIGYERESWELLLAGFKGDFEKTNALAALAYSGIENVEIGLFWSGNVGESLEFRELQREALEEDEEGELLANATMGMGGFLAIYREPFIIDFEYIAALETFNAGLLDDDPRRPRAWNFEVAVNPWERWQFATRIESSKHLPDSPKWQYGLAVSYGLQENLIVTANYLRGEFRDEVDKRTLLQLELIFEY